MIKLIATDFDGTLVNFDNEPFNSGWDAVGSLLAEEKRKKWHDIRDYYIDKLKKLSEEDKIETYNRWFRDQLKLLEGVNEDFLKEKLFPLKYSPGAEEFFKEAKRQGRITGILSSGIDFLIEQAVIDFKMDFFACCKLEKQGKIFTGKGESTINLYNKLDYLKKLCKDYKISLEEVCYLGDNFNCEPVLKAAGLGIAFNPKTEETRKAAKHTIHDFRDALSLIKNYDMKNNLIRK